MKAVNAGGLVLRRFGAIAPQPLQIAARREVFAFTGDDHAFHVALIGRDILSDVVAVLGSLNIIAAELDR